MKKGIRVTFSFVGDTKACMELAPSIHGLADSLAAGLSRESSVVGEARDKMREAGLKVREPQWIAELLNS